MKNKRFSARLPGRKDRIAIKTTFLDLLKEITDLTKDDAVVLEVVKRIFNSHRVRLVRTLAPVRLVNGKAARRVMRRNRPSSNTMWAY
jgi:hypothetical protein